jgi:hypothetical protein
VKPSESMRLVAKLAAAYPHAKLGTGEQLRNTLQVYAEMLQDLDYETTARAIAGHLAESKYFPTIAEIRQAVAAAKVDQPPGELAWSEVLAAVSKFGIYRTPVFANPCTAIAVSNVGWKAICNSTTIGVERAHFLRAYEQARQLALRAENTDRLLEHVDRKRLAGVHDAAEDDDTGAQSIAAVVRMRIGDGGGE